MCALGAQLCFIKLSLYSGSFFVLINIACGKIAKFNDIFLENAPPKRGKIGKIANCEIICFGIP